MFFGHDADDTAVVDFGVGEEEGFEVGRGDYVWGGGVDVS